MNRLKLKRAKENLQDSPEKRDEVRAISALAGMLLGSVIGVPISIAVGLLGEAGRGLLYYDFLGNLMQMSSFFSFSVLFGCLITFATCSHFWKKEQKASLLHCGLSVLTLLFVWVYIFLLFAFVFIPFNVFLLQYFTPVSVFWDVMLVFFPFMAIFAYISFPTLRPRMRHQLGLLVTRGFWSGIRRNPRPHRKMLLITTALLIVIVIDILTVLY